MSVAARSTPEDDETGAGRQVIQLPSGRRLEIETDDRERLWVRAPDGRVELHVRLTAAGPVLEMEAAALTLRSDANVRVECDRFDVHAREGMRMTTQGDLEQQVEGDHSVTVKGTSRTAAAEVEAVASGDMTLTSGDDLRADGKRVLINC